MPEPRPSWRRKLIETNADELKWTVRWYGTEDRPRLSGKFAPMWREIDDNTDEETAEVYSVKQPVKHGFSYQPFAGTVIGHTVGSWRPLDRFASHTVQTNLTRFLGVRLGYIYPRF